MKKIYSLIFLIILSTSIISCGYQLRNAPEINFDSISINGGSSGFIKILKKKFKQSIKHLIKTSITKEKHQGCMTFGSCYIKNIVNKESPELLHGN